MASSRNRIKVFVASTVYNFEYELQQIYNLLDGYGYDVYMSHKGTLPLDSSKSNEQTCLDAVKEVDIFVGFIRPDYGSGVFNGVESITHLDLILRRFSENGLKKPEWTFNNGYTTLILFCVEEEIVFNERMMKFLKDMQGGEIFSTKNYLTFFENLSDRVARNDISKLVAGGWLEKIGDGPATRYERTKLKLPDSSK